MSELEQIRAVTLLSLLGAVLLVLFSLRSHNGMPALPSPDPLRLCAVTHGAICEPVGQQAPTRYAGRDDVATLGHILVTAPRLVPSPRRFASIESVALLGSMTVTAPKPVEFRDASAAGHRPDRSVMVAQAGPRTLGEAHGPAGF